jgi:hypothetical protein
MNTAHCSEMESVTEREREREREEEEKEEAIFSLSRLHDTRGKRKRKQKTVEQKSKNRAQFRCVRGGEKSSPGDGLCVSMIHSFPLLLFKQKKNFDDVLFFPLLSAHFFPFGVRFHSSKLLFFF